MANTVIMYQNIQKNVWFYLNILNFIQVNGKTLVGLSHQEVVSTLKELPQHVRIVAARSLPYPESIPGSPILGSPEKPPLGAKVSNF